MIVVVGGLHGSHFLRKRRGERRAAKVTSVEDWIERLLSNNASIRGHVSQADTFTAQYDCGRVVME